LKVDVFGSLDMSALPFRRLSNVEYFDAGVLPSIMQGDYTQPVNPRQWPPICLPSVHSNDPANLSIEPDYGKTSYDIDPIFTFANCQEKGTRDRENPTGILFKGRSSCRNKKRAFNVPATV